MKKIINKHFGLAILALLLVAGVMVLNGSVKVGAATRKGYTITTANTRVYSNTKLTVGYGWIYPTDEVTVITVTGTYSKVSYPAGGRTKTGYIATSAILTATGGTTYTSRGKFTTYRRDNTVNSYGYVAINDKVLVLGTRGSYTQIKYPVSGGYKYAFAKTSDVNTYLKNTAVAANNNTGNAGPITAEQAKTVMFDAQYYADSYADLKAAFGYNAERLYNHYLTCGIKEGRSASPIFDPVFYLNNNSDLKKAFGNNYTLAYNHWIKYGCNEGRYSSKYYQGTYYKNRYDDLSGMSYYDLARHYLKYGITERRWANSNGYLPGGGNNTKTYSVSGDLLTVNGVALTEYRVGSRYTSSRFATVNGKSVDMYGWQCCGFARYVAQKLYGCHDKNAPAKFRDVSGTVSARNLNADKLKSFVTSAGVGAHMRTGGSSHSMVLIEVTDNDFTVVDANSDGKNTIRVKTYTWSEYMKSTYGSRGLLYIKKYVG